VSSQPSAMAIGATWDAVWRGRPANVKCELEALGINPVLGPSLDVLQDPRQIGQGDLGAVGGDPYWAGVMGGPHRGLHSARAAAGGGGRLGLGGSDPRIEEKSPRCAVAGPAGTIAGSIHCGWAPPRGPGRNR
jgi:hypothetical protein